MSPDFSVFQEPEALRINRVRQEHLASLGLELHGKSVLEVGAGIGLHTDFFEERGCDVLSTDGNPPMLPRCSGFIRIAKSACWISIGWSTSPISALSTSSIVTGRFTICGTGRRPGPARQSV